uniref:Peptidyl-prolyl cis-trans isomerase n=1 Tax=Amphora coffeiformis TaxID=265554 RepID=A0A7S3L2Y7_9STRA
MSCFKLILTLALFLGLARNSHAFATLPSVVASPSIGTVPGVTRDGSAFSRHTSSSSSSLSMGLLDGVGGFFKRFTTKATASHILIRGGAEAEFKLQDLKKKIGDSPVKFAEAAAKFSECPSKAQGGSLGEFGPGAMVKEFDEVVFNEKVGQVHGPVKTQFGYHLIYIADRTE